MLKKFNKRKPNNSGQNAIEYMLVLCIVILTFIAFAGPGGPFFQKLNSTLFTSHNAVEAMAFDIYYNVYDEPGTTTDNQ